MSSIVNPANGVTAARYLTLPPFWYCIANGMTQWATLIALICGLFDLFDGADNNLLLVYRFAQFYPGLPTGKPLKIIQSSVGST